MRLYCLDDLSECMLMKYTAMCYLGESKFTH